MLNELISSFNFTNKQTFQNKTHFSTNSLSILDSHKENSYGGRNYIQLNCTN